MPVNPEIKVLQGKNGGNEGDETGSGKKGDVITVGKVCCDEM